MSVRSPSFVYSAWGLPGHFCGVGRRVLVRRGAGAVRRGRGAARRGIARAGLWTEVEAEVAGVGGAEERAEAAGRRVFGGSVVPTVVCVLGGPGSGKGTLSRALAGRLGYAHLSAGDLLREVGREDSERGRMVAALLARGAIVPSPITLEALYGRIGEVLRARAPRFPFQRRVLVDGFPRNLDNLLAWERTGGVFQAAVSILCDESALVERLNGRAKNSARADDHSSVIPLRLEAHRRDFAAIERHYARKGLLVPVDGQAPPREVALESERKLAFLERRMLLELNQQLLEAIASGDYGTYDALVDPDLSCFEPEAAGCRVEGKGFHKFYFGAGPAPAGAGAGLAAEATPCQGVRTDMVDAKVRLVGDAAVVSYLRVVQQQSRTDVFEETRVWERKREKGNVWWKMVHFHRSKAPGRYRRAED